MTGLKNITRISAAVCSSCAGENPGATAAANAGAKTKPAAPAKIKKNAKTLRRLAAKRHASSLLF